MDKELKAAIIGYWRSGATVEQIINLTGLYYLEIMAVVDSIKIDFVEFNKN